MYLLTKLPAAISVNKRIIYMNVPRRTFSRIIQPNMNLFDFTDILQCVK